MKLYIGNAFSLSMLEREIQSGQYARTPRPLTLEDVKGRLARAQTLGIEIVSCIGHTDTAALLGGILGAELQANRSSVKLDAKSALIVGQYIGPRLPEGETMLPEGATIEWWIV